MFLDLHVDTAQFRKSMGEMGTMAAGAVGILGTAIAGAGLKAAIEWESAFAGVRKTVDATEGELSVLSDTLREMAGELGTPVEELARLAEAAGALGIKVPDIAEFTRVAAQLGVTTDVSADAAATALGKINAVIPLSREEFGRFASTLVDLGNKGASTESQIIDMAQNMAGAASVIGMSVPQMLGWAAAAANVGIEAEAGASSFQRFGLGVQKFVVDGGPKLEEIARLTGMTKEAFAELWGQDSSEALRRIIAGLAEMDGQTRQATIAALGFTELRLGKYLMTLSANQDNLNDSLRVGQEAWHENAAMGVEFAKRAETVEFQLGQMRAELHDIAITIGEALLPHLRNFVGLAREVISGIQGWMRENKGLADNLIQIGTLLSGILALKWGAKFIGALLGQFGIGTLGAALTRAVLPSATLAGGKGGEAMGLSFGEAFMKYALLAAPLLALSHAAQEVTKHIAPAAVAVQDFTLVMGRNAHSLRQFSNETGVAFEQLQGQFAKFLREGMDPAAALAATKAWAQGLKGGLPKPGDPTFIGPVETLGTQVGAGWGTGVASGIKRTYVDFVGAARAGADAVSEAYRRAVERKSALEAYNIAWGRSMAEALSKYQGNAWRGGQDVAGSYSDAVQDSRSTLRQAWQRFLDAMKDPISAAEDMAWVHGKLTGEKLAQGLRSSDPRIRDAAQAQQQLLRVEYRKLLGEMYQHGMSAMERFAQGMRDRIGLARAAARDAAGAVGRYMELRSPAKEGPFSRGGGPEGWGERFGLLWARGLDHSPLGSTLRSVLPTMPAFASSLGNLNGTQTLRHDHTVHLDLANAPDGITENGVARIVYEVIAREASGASLRWND